MEEDKVKACPLERTMPSDPNMSQQSSFRIFPRSVMRRLGPLGLFPTSLRHGHRALTDQRPKKITHFLAYIGSQLHSIVIPFSEQLEPLDSVYQHHLTLLGPT